MTRETNTLGVATPEQIAACLRGGADIIDRGGWWDGGTNCEGGHCVITSLTQAALELRLPEAARLQARFVMIDLVAGGDIQDTATGTLFRWNDSQDHHTVVTMMRRAADLVEAEAGVQA